MVLHGFFVIGVSGVTNGGKSSLTDRLKDEFKGAIFINQDDYFITIDDPKHIWIKELNHQNWEIPSAINFEKLKSDVEALCRSAQDLENKLLIIEGHTLFSDPTVVQWCDLRYFFTLTKEQCFARRSNRVYEPADPPGYFDMCVWPEHLNYKNYVSTHVNSVEYLDGSQDQDKLLSRIVKDIRQAISAKGS